MAQDPSSDQIGTFKILYFATAASYTKKEHDLLPAPLPLARLFDLLEERYPGINKAVLSSCAVTLNLEYVDLDAQQDGRPVLILAGSEVAIIPPVSSG